MPRGAVINQRCALIGLAIVQGDDLDSTVRSWITKRRTLRGLPDLPTHADIQAIQRTQVEARISPRAARHGPAAARPAPPTVLPPTPVRVRAFGLNTNAPPVRLPVPAFVDAAASPVPPFPAVSGSSDQWLSRSTLRATSEHAPSPVANAPANAAGGPGLLIKPPRAGALSLDPAAPLFRPPQSVACPADLRIQQPVAQPQCPGNPLDTIADTLGPAANIAGGGQLAQPAAAGAQRQLRSYEEMAEVLQQMHPHIADRFWLEYTDCYVLPLAANTLGHYLHLMTFLLSLNFFPDFLVCCCSYVSDWDYPCFEAENVRA
jgi:hypothetical protein